MSLIDYVRQHVARGDCTCGRCIDAAKNPQQPTGHTVDLMFFKVAMLDEDKGEFLKLAQSQYPHWFDGKEHNYLELGADLGDQGIALMTMGCGALAGVFELRTPATVMPFLSREYQLEMAGSGMITIQAKT